MSGKSRRERIEEMLAEDAGNAELRYFLAMEHKAAGDTPRAVECLRDTVSRTPDYVPAYLQLGQLLGQLGEEDDAKAVYRRGIQEAQKKGDAHAAGEMTTFLAMLE
jgi:Tfp pilus assembly protein PilF